MAESRQARVIAPHTLRCVSSNHADSGLEPPSLVAGLSGYPNLAAGAAPIARLGVGVFVLLVLLTLIAAWLVAA
jgi:uncharacterized membrane protein YtjA (UPF0391 family)